MLNTIRANSKIASQYNPASIRRIFYPGSIINFALRQLWKAVGVRLDPQSLAAKNRPSPAHRRGLSGRLRQAPAKRAPEAQAH